MLAAMTPAAAWEIVAAWPQTQNRLEIRLLGTFQVTVDGRPAGTGGSKRDALLALLALRRGRPVSVDALIDELWGADVPASPRNAIHHHVARLRAALGQESIVGFAQRVRAREREHRRARLRGPARRGARSAARGRRAHGGRRRGAGALRSGAGGRSEGLPETIWVGAEADRLEGLRIDALEERFEAALELGEHREIVSELQRAIHESPFRERLWRQLMVALYRSGRAADALETYQSARRVHVEQLGLEPGPELRRTQEAILAHDPEIAGSPPHAGPGAACRRSTSRATSSPASSTSSARTSGTRRSSTSGHAARSRDSRRSPARPAPALGWRFPASCNA